MIVSSIIHQCVQLSRNSAESGIKEKSALRRSTGDGKNEEYGGGNYDDQIIRRQKAGIAGGKSQPPLTLLPYYSTPWRVCLVSFPNCYLTKRQKML
jgi:hypothetical protein